MLFENHIRVLRTVIFGTSLAWAAFACTPDLFDIKEDEFLRMNYRGNWKYVTEIAQSELFPHLGTILGTTDGVPYKIENSLSKCLPSRSFLKTNQLDKVIKSSSTVLQIFINPELFLRVNRIKRGGPKFKDVRKVGVFIGLLVETRYPPETQNTVMDQLRSHVGSVSLCPDVNDGKHHLVVGHLIAKEGTTFTFFGNGATVNVTPQNIYDYLEEDDGPADGGIYVGTTKALSNKFDFTSGGSMVTREPVVLAFQPRKIS